VRAFVAFTKKEFTESVRSYRLFVLAVVFLLLGIMSPLVAKLMPDLISGTDLGGVTITLPEPTAMDSWAQFFGNVGQMGMLALVITFSGIMATELSRGTLVNLLTKGMKRHTVILSKFLTASLIWTVSYLLCMAVCFAYTEYYWPAATLHEPFLAFFAPWLFGMLMIVLLILGGILFGNLYGSLLTCLTTVIALSLINIASVAHKYNPISLASGTLNLLNGHMKAADFIPAAIICAVAVVILLVTAIAAFNKKQV